MNKKNLFWIIPLTLFIGWTIGFYVGIPKHITFDTSDKLTQDINNVLDRAENITKGLPECKSTYYNITSYANYGYGEYSKLLSELNRCNNAREYFYIMTEMCSDKVFCDCDDFKERNAIIDNVLKGNNSKKFIIWERRNVDGKIPSFNEGQIRNIVSYLGNDQSVEIWRVE